jgi:hypothetical protein
VYICILPDYDTVGTETFAFHFNKNNCKKHILLLAGCENYYYSFVVDNIHAISLQFAVRMDHHHDSKMTLPYLYVHVVFLHSGKADFGEMSQTCCFRI